jgi:glycosyltransferase involved in cell wall biosynthesis
VKILHFAPAFSGGIGSALEGLLAIAAPGLEHVRVEATTPREQRDGATLVHCHHALAWPDAAATARALGVPAVKTVHVLQARQSRMRGLPGATRSEAHERRALAEAEALTIGTRAARALLLEDHPWLDPERVSVLGIPSRLPLVPRDEAARSVVAVTRFDALKGTDLLIEVVREVLRGDGAARFTVAGGLPENPRAEQRWIEAFEAALPPEDRPRFRFVGWLGAEGLAALLGSARVFVSASRLETYGLALVEAARAGCRVVASDIPVHREVVPGARLAAADAAELAAAVTGALDDEEDGVKAPGVEPTPGQIASEWLHFWSQTR